MQMKRLTERSQRAVLNWQKLREKRRKDSGKQTAMHTSTCSCHVRSYLMTQSPWEKQKNSQMDVLKSKLSRTDRRTFRPRFRWEMLIHIWISPRHWKDASGEKRSLGSDTLYVFLFLETQVYKYIYVIVDHWFFWVTG